jgi:hypothetical protein
VNKLLIIKDIEFMQTLQVEEKTITALTKAVQARMELNGTTKVNISQTFQHNQMTYQWIKERVFGAGQHQIQIRFDECLVSHME